jgi:mannose-6-phosphate isomerase-like protein (cupin superfamily)
VELDVGQPLLLVPGGGVGSTELQKSGGAGFAGAGAGKTEVVGDSSDRRVEILCDRDELVVTWTRFGPYRDGASPHVHHTHSDLFFVLGGELMLFVGPEREERVLPEGTLAFAPPLLVHGFRNGGADELRYLNFHAPSGGFADYLRGRNPDFDQWEPPEDGGLPLTEAVIVPPGTDGVLIDRQEIRIEVRGRDEQGQSAASLTCLYALPDERLLEIRV